MKDYQIKVLGISEMRWPGTGEMISANGNMVVYSNNQQYGFLGGVGLIISRQLRNSLIEWKPVSERIISARFHSRIKKVSIIQCYAPTEVAEDLAKDEFYEQLTSTLMNTPRSDIVILMGDFNAKIGTTINNQQYRGIIGAHGMDTATNNNGERLTGICMEHSLSVGGTLFPHKEIHKYTWTSPDGRTRNQIDHICISKKWRSSLRDVRTRRGADIGSDHMLVTGDIRIRLSSQPNNNPGRPRKLNIRNLKNTTIVTKFREELSLQINQQSTEMQNNITNLQQSIRSISEKVIGHTIPGRQEWISEETWRLINERRKLKIELLNSRDEQRVAKYQQLIKEIKKSARKDKRKYYDNIAKEAEVAARQNNMRGLYGKIRQLSRKGMQRNHPILHTDGTTLLTSTQDQVNRWKEHFCNNSGTNSDINANGNNEAAITMNNENNNITNIRQDVPDTNEIIRAINRLKNNKAEGIDGIPAELLKANAELMANILQPILQTIWAEEQLPNEWTKGIIIKLPKKGDLRYCNNWRGITLLNTLNKALAMIVLERISEHVEQNMRREQAGFRSGRSCVDQSNTLRIIMEQAVEWNTPLYVVFIDFERAFDTLQREFIWRALRKKGIPNKIINVIKALYSNAKTSVLHNGQLSEEFEIEYGVRQGCPLSPLLFNCALDEIMKESTRVSRGIKWSLFDSLEDLDYADDIALLAHKYSEMQQKLDILATNARKAGLRVNTRKTKTLRINTNIQAPLTVYGEQIEEVVEFTYLGSIIDTKGGSEADISNRISQAKRAFGRLHMIWRSSQLSRKTKLSIFNACVKSVLIYGSETWHLNESDKNRLQVFVNKCLRIICRIFWPNRITNVELWNITGQENIANQIRRKKWRFIGHTLRKPDTEIAKQALEWNPPGKRKVGRPRNTWRRANNSELKTHGTSWERVKHIAQDRTEWKSFVEALCSQEE